MFPGKSSVSISSFEHGGVCGKGPAPSADIKGSFKG